MKDFQVASGSVMGTDHQKLGKNNQDGYGFVQTENYVIGIVCDGCSDGASNEVGAALAVNLIIAAIIRNLNIFASRNLALDSRIITNILENARQDVLFQIKQLALGMGGNVSQIINDYFLFTIVGALILSDQGIIFSIGDGAYVLNSNTHIIGPFPDNAPPYLSYSITGSSVTDEHPDLLKFKVESSLTTESIESIVIGSDGLIDLYKISDQRMPGKKELVGPLSQFWEQDRYLKNPDLLRRRLFMINQQSKKYNNNQQKVVIENGLLRDDTTMIVIRNKNLKQGEDHEDIS